MRHNGQRTPSCIAQRLAMGVALGSLFPFLSCTHPIEEIIRAELPMRTVQLHMTVDWRYGGHVYEMSSMYEDDFGHAYVLDTLRFFVSGAHAMGEGDVLLADYSNVFMVVDGTQPQNELALGELTAASLHEISFYLGLPPDVNHADPALALPPLDDLSMHSGSVAQGYSFLYVAGRVDSDGNGTIDQTDQRFGYRCIGDPLICPAMVTVHTELPDGGTLRAALPIDMEELMANIDLLNTPSTAGAGDVNWDWMQRLREAIEQEH